jgi:hypothetical protein
MLDANSFLDISLYNLKKGLAIKKKYVYPSYNVETWIHHVLSNLYT